MPKPYAPVYSEWSEVFQQFKLDGNTNLIRHSCGGGFLIRYLIENDCNIENIYLVAPWLDPDDELGNDFFNFDLNISLLSRAQNVCVLGSSDDMNSVQISIEKLKNAWKDAQEKVQFLEYKNKGHFCENDLNGREFPDLLQLILLES